MNSWLIRFEAIESRFLSYSCPRGASGRVHSLRLRRCFRSLSRAATPATQQTFSPSYNAYNVRSIGDPPRQNDSLSEITQRNQEPVNYRRPSLLSRKDLYLRETLLRHRQLRYRGIRRAILGSDIVPHMSGKPPREVVVENEAKLHNGLRVGNAHEVMQSLMNIVQLESFDYSTSILVSAPPPIFSEILRCIDPKHFVDPYVAVFKEISSASTRLLGSGDILGDEDYYEFCDAFLAQATQIIGARRRRWPLSISDYKYLLKCAKAVGHAKAAEKIWEAMLTARSKNQTILPDVEAFNHYLAVKCWQDTINPKHRYRLRVIEENFAPRSWLVPPHSLSLHRVGPNGGIKSQASALFRHMVELGLTGNEETFCLMMIALGREGDLNGISSILSRVWNIDVNAVMDDVPGIKPPTPYGPGSPFFPSNHLLYSIAHAYGTNNEISMALRLIDYVSRHYSIDISLNVWNELLQWTFVVSINKRLVRKKAFQEKPTGRETGQLPSAAVSNLWQTMISEPYNVKPTLQMYDRLITSLMYRERFGEMQTRMEEARKVLKADILVLGKKEATYLAIQGRNHTSLIEARARDLIHTRFRVWRNRQYVKRWVRLLISRSKSMRFNDSFTAQTIPNIVQNWLLFMPRKLKYRTATGKVSLLTGTHALKRWGAGMRARRIWREAKRIASWDEMEDSVAQDSVTGEGSE